MNLNKIVFIGRISQDPVLYEAKTGVNYVRLTLAITRDNQNKNNEDITDFIPLVAFDNTANFINNFFSKGDLVSVTGSLQSSQYTTKSGDVVSTLNVLIDQIRSLEPRSVTQARAERKNTTIFNKNKEQQPKNEQATSFYVEEKQTTNNNLEDDNPWELDF